MILPKDARDRAKFGDASLRAALEMTETTASTESRRIIDEMAREKGSRPSVIVAQILRDAERFKALERENDTNQSDYHCRWCFWHKNLGYHIHEAKLAELADRLREGAK